MFLTCHWVLNSKQSIITQTHFLYLMKNYLKHPELKKISINSSFSTYSVFFILQGRREFPKSLLNFFDEWCHSDHKRHLNADRMYAIGIPDSGSELEDLKEIKKCIANIVKSPRYSKENIRPVWALFEHILNIMKENRKVISRKTLSDYIDQLIAQEFRIDESEISKMLDFFHRVGVLLYFDKDGLKEKIILDIQWLLDAFKCIIEYPVRTEVNDMKRRHFYRTGELDNVELDRIWHIQGKDFLKHKTTMIAYMQQLGLLIPLKELHSIDSTVYYFPSMNRKRFDKTGENNSKSSILCFKFDDEMQLPINVFHGIVLKCSKINNWSILTEGAKNNICLYQNTACFSFQKHVVVLCNCNFEIRVQVWASPEIYDGRLLKEIKHLVEDIIHDDDLSYEIGYKCRKDVLNVEEDVSFISQSTFPVSNHLCEICDVDKKHVVDNDICWELEVNGENQDTWTEDIELGNLRVLLESFKIVVPNSSRESIVKTLLDESLLNECVNKVRSLARRVVLCKNFDEKNKKQNPGTVMVYEVIVMNEDNEVFIYEKDPEYWAAFLEEKQEEDLVKVILIEGIWQNVSKTKEKVYQKYQKYIDSGKFHLHHESEQYSGIAKISALQSIKLCQQYVESVRASIPLDTIDDIVKKSTYRALTEERIKEMCCNTYIDGVGTANDDPYFVRFFLTLNRIKGEIKQKTIESIKERLRSELCVEITRHINLELQSKFELATVSLAIHHISGMLLVLIASLLNPIAGAVTGLVSLVFGQDVNSRRWREKIAMEISDEISRVQIFKKLSSHLWTIFHETSDNLKNVVEDLEEYRRRIAYTD
ncbi:uncharacterized protein [Magallana gigas]|uniref:uncharacterized protein n=1 Tax=Magallana gigas TaxID=29159 RepID=UPI0033421093